MSNRNNNYIPTKCLRNKDWLIDMRAEASLTINAINRMIMKYVEGKSIKEIAYLENVDVNTIEQSLRRSRKKLHSFISEKEKVVPT